jgi:uncharacterized membrane protein HdeD (DUF308 family)
VVEVALPPEEVKKVRRWLMIAGILAILGGAAAIAIPALASVAITLFIGWFLVAAGIVMTMHAFQMRSRAHFPLRLLTGVLTVLIGLLLVIFPASGTLTLTFLLSTWFIATGLLYLMTWWQTRGVPGAGLTGFNGALSLILGILIALDLPSSADWAIGLLFGVNLMFWGVRALFTWSALRRALPNP